MADTQRLSRPVVIVLPREIDAINADEAAEPLRAACTRGAIVIADMANTTFCDAHGASVLLNVHYCARASGCELRVARACAEVLRVWTLLGAERILPIYPTLDGARFVNGVPRRKARLTKLIGRAAGKGR